MTSAVPRAASRRRREAKQERARARVPPERQLAMGGRSDHIRTDLNQHTVLLVAAFLSLRDRSVLCGVSHSYWRRLVSHAPLWTAVDLRDRHLRLWELVAYVQRHGRHIQQLAFVAQEDGSGWRRHHAFLPWLLTHAPTVLPQLHTLNVLGPVDVATIVGFVHAGVTTLTTWGDDVSPISMSTTIAAAAVVTHTARLHAMDTAAAAAEAATSSVASGVVVRVPRILHLNGHRYDIARQLWITDSVCARAPVAGQRCADESAVACDRCGLPSCHRCRPLQRTMVHSHAAEMFRLTAQLREYQTRLCTGCIRQYYWPVLRDGSLILKPSYH